MKKFDIIQFLACKDNKKVIYISLKALLDKCEQEKVVHFVKHIFT